MMLERGNRRLDIEKPLVRGGSVWLASGKPCFVRQQPT